MTYDSELLFLRETLNKCRIQTFLADPFTSPDWKLDRGLRQMLDREDLYDINFLDEFRRAKGNTVYRMTDMFFCSYMFMLLPECKEHTVMVIGPYMSAELTHEQLMEEAEQHGVPPTLFQQLEKYYSAVPVVTGDNVLFAVVDTFAERIWGGAEEYVTVDINQESSLRDLTFFSWEDPNGMDETDWNIKEVEARYTRENELIQAVSMGQTHKVELLMAGFTNLSFERRLADPVRNLKNYCIIMNTILRKAAESGGVHPVYLDRISSDFAKRIELISSTDGVRKVMTAMYTDYCRLVKNHATQNLTPPVQKAVMHINFGLSGDLSLHALAEAQNINASYLSSLFKKEMGQTVTDYVNQKRIHRAEKLLSTTKLQIQTVAQYCGIADVNYFSKLFKKYTGKTPKEFRRDNQAAPQTQK